MEFEYKAIDASGKMTDGTAEAASRLDLVSSLKEKGLTPIDIKLTAEAELEKKPTGKIKFSFEFGVSEKRLLFFTRQFATILKAGIPMLRCLDMLKNQTSCSKLRQILVDVTNSIMQGKSLSDALKPHNPPFDDLYLSMVKVGEKTGDMANIMGKLADSIENQYELKQKIKSAMAYPGFILVFSFVMVYLMVTKLLPTFTAIFKDSGLNISRDYPITQFLINLSDLASQPWFLASIISVCILLFVLYKVMVKIPGGKMIIDKAKFYFPFLQGFIQMQYFAQLADSLATLTASGITILDSLKLAGNACNNEVVRKAFKDTETLIEKGEGFSVAAAKTGIFPQIMIQMISVGEETGELSDMLARVSAYYKRELDGSLNSLTSLIEPIMMIIVGIAVFFFVVGVLLPVEGISQAYQSNM